MARKSTSHVQPVPGHSNRFALWVYVHLQQFRQTMREIWHTPLTSLMTIGVIGVSLALPAALMVILKNAETVTAQWQSGTQITLYLQKGTSDAEIQALQDRIRQNRQVESVRYISPEQGMSEFKALSGFSEAQAYLSDNPLPPVLEVKPWQAFRSPQESEQLLQNLKQESAVQQAKLDIQWVTRLNGIIALARQLVHVFGGFLVIGLLLTVANTLRLYIFNRRAEIEVMKLVGATDGFIQRPFLYLGFWYGAVGGLLAWWLSEVLLLLSEEAVTYLAELYDSSFRLTGLGFADGGLLLLLGISLSMGAAWFSVHKHLREIEPR